jgi:hypothetical protein
VPETESLRRAEAAFRREHPLYADTAALDELRLTDFARLEHGRHVYLDYTLVADKARARSKGARTHVGGTPERKRRRRKRAKRQGDGEN